jgi:hypothetical protein
VLFRRSAEKNLRSLVEPETDAGAAHVLDVERGGDRQTGRGHGASAMIDRHAASQWSGVLGSLNMIADAFKLLPKESETKRRKWIPFLAGLVLVG